LKQVLDTEDARSLAQIIVDTVREPVLVLDDDLNIRFASRSFHRAFRTDAAIAPHQHLFALDDSVWYVQALRELFEKNNYYQPAA
jgi:nitrogen-specific signal transduction histidine kinase